MQPLGSGSVLVRIIRWHESKAWTDNVAHARKMLVSAFRASGPVSNLEAKRLIKAVIAKRASEIFLLDGTHYSSMLHCLQSIGAEVEAISRPSMSSERSPDAA